MAVDYSNGPVDEEGSATQFTTDNPADEVNAQAYVNPYLQQNQQSITNALNQTLALKTPQAQAASAGATTQAQAASAGPASQVRGTQLNTANSNQDRSAQQALNNTLIQQANGGAQTAADLATTKANNQALQNLQAAAASTRGGISPANTARTLARNLGDQEQQNALNAGQVALQSQQSAQGQLASNLNNLSQNDINLAQAQAGLTQQANLANQSAVNNQNQFNASNAQQTALANQNAQNNMAQFNASNAQQANLANQNAQLQMNNLDANAVANYNNAALNQNNQQFQANMAESQAVQNADQQRDQLLQQQWQTNQGNDFHIGSALQGAVGGAIGDAIGGVGSAIAGLFAHGGRIPGKAEVHGDSYSNDKVPILASPGELVVPRSIADDPEKTKQFAARERLNHELASRHAAPDGDEQELIAQLPVIIAAISEMRRQRAKGGR